MASNFCRPLETPAQSKPGHPSSEHHRRPLTIFFSHLVSERAANDDTPIKATGDQSNTAPDFAKIKHVMEIVNKIDCLDNGRQKSSTHKRQDQQDCQLHFLLPGFTVTEPRLLSAIERASAEYERKTSTPTTNVPAELIGSDANLVLQILNVIRNNKEDGPSKICFDAFERGCTCTQHTPRWVTRRKK